MKRLYLLLCLLAFACQGFAQPHHGTGHPFVVGSYNQYHLQEIRELLISYASLERFSGNILLAEKDQLLLIESKESKAGVPDQYRVSSWSPSDIGSLSKQFTAAAILQLAHRGQLELDQEINNYLGAFASRRWKNVKVHHLLCHTSGIPSLYQSGQNLTQVIPKAEAITLADLIDHFRDLKLQAKPGKKFRYNNSGYVLLAAIIEQLTGKSYAEYMEQDIFKAYGLESTSVGPPEESVYTLGHFNYRQDLQVPAPFSHPSWILGAGGIYSTVRDLWQWNQLIHSTEFLTEEWREHFFQAHTKLPHQISYGYGWQVHQGSGQQISHGAVASGYLSHLSYFPENGLTLILLSNQTHDSYSKLDWSRKNIEEISQKILAILDEQATDTLLFRLETPLDNPPIGTYQFANGQQIQIDWSNSNNPALLITNQSAKLPHLLRISTTQPLPNDNQGLFQYQNPQSLAPAAVLAFPLKDGRWLIDGFPLVEEDAFLEVLEKDGQTTKLRLHQYNRSFELEKVE